MKNTVSEEARQARNAYHREWNKKNKEKKRTYMERYWAKKAAEKSNEQSN